MWQGGKLVSENWAGQELEFFYDESGSPYAFSYKSSATATPVMYYYVTNLQGDVVNILNASGSTVASYSYNAWGKVLTATGTMAAVNPLRYRGYYYDTDTGLYYLQSRYYDPQICRFINADNLTSTGQGILGTNAFSYCANNPVSRVDTKGSFWESAFDIISLGASIVEVAVNPTDPWAWASLIGDTIDLIPFVTGTGELTRLIRTSVTAVDKVDDVIDSAKALRRAADATSDLKKATGSYEILFRNNFFYVGKGGFSRAIQSASRYIDGANFPQYIRWKSAPNAYEAFIDEYYMQMRMNDFIKLHPEFSTYNKIWSPGRNYVKWK